MTKKNKSCLLTLLKSGKLKLKLVGEAKRHENDPEVIEWLERCEKALIEKLEEQDQ